MVARSYPDARTDWAAECVRFGASTTSQSPQVESLSSKVVNPIAFLTRITIENKYSPLLWDSGGDQLQLAFLDSCRVSRRQQWMLERGLRDKGKELSDRACPKRGIGLKRSFTKFSRSGHSSFLPWACSRLPSPQFSVSITSN